jgi:hypothetical protein
LAILLSGYYNIATSKTIINGIGKNYFTSSGLKCIYDFRLVLSFKAGGMAVMESNCDKLGHCLF